MRLPDQGGKQKCEIQREKVYSKGQTIPCQSSVWAPQAGLDLKTVKQSQYISIPSGTETFCDNYVNMGTDNLAPFISSSSATMILTMQDLDVLVSHKK